MDTFRWQGVELAYSDTGDGPPILFLHNGGTSSTIWRHQLAALGAEHRCIAVDLPGFGCTPRPEDPLDHAGLVAITAALLDHLGIRGAVAVGNCMGANLAVHLATSRPDLVDTLVIVNPLTEATFDAGWLGLTHRSERLAPGPTRFVRRIARRIVPPKLGAETTIRLQLGPKGIAQGLHHDPELVALNQRSEQMPALIDVLDDMGAYGELDRLENLDVPTTMVWGAANRVLSPKVGATLARRLGVDRSVVLDGCGHLAMLEEPDAVTALIVERCDRRTGTLR